MAAQAVLDEVFEVTDRGWRGIGVIPSSGWKLSEAYRDFDAEIKFTVSAISRPANRRFVALAMC